LTPKRFIAKRIRYVRVIPHEVTYHVNFLFHPIDGIMKKSNIRRKFPRLLTVVDVRDPSRASLANTRAEHAGESLLRDLGDGNGCQSQNSDEQQSLGHIVWCRGGQKNV
jgi:hypothetical protein